MPRPGFQTTFSWLDRLFPALLLPLILLAPVLLFPLVEAQAYRIGGEQILGMMTDRLGKGGRCNVVQKLTLYNGYDRRDGQKQPARVLTEVQNMDPPSAFRSDISMPAGSENRRRTHVVASGQSLILLDNQIDTAGETVFDQYMDLLLYRTPETLFPVLQACGVDTAVTSLGLFDGKPCYIVGAEYPDKSRVQIWLNKDTALPARWLFPQGAGKAAAEFEIRYLNWEQGPSPFIKWHPMRIVFYQAGALVREIRVEEVRTVKSFPAGLFDVERIRALYGSRPDPETVPADEKAGLPAEMLEVRQIIEEFGKMYE